MREKEKKHTRTHIIFESILDGGNTENEHKGQEGGDAAKGRNSGNEGDNDNYQEVYVGNAANRKEMLVG